VREDSPSRLVGHEVAASPLGKIAHEVRMMSLDNAFADTDVEDFAARVRRYLNLPPDAELAMTAEDKIDGLSCSLRYEAGQLVRAATRGDAKPLVSMRDRLQNRWIRTTYTEAARHGKIDKTGRESETT
jgi:DNA ligase (NAD+)